MVRKRQFDKASLNLLLEIELQLPGSANGLTAYRAAVG